MDTQTTRRGLLAAAGLATVAAAVPGAAQATTATAPGPEIVRLIAAYDRANDRFARFNADVLDPEIERRRAATAEYQATVEAVPHVEEFGGKSIGGAPVTFTSRKSYARSQAEHYIECDAREPNRGGDWQDTIDAARRFIVADNRRNQAIDALGGPPSQLSKISDLEDAALRPVIDASHAVYDFPCRTLADLSAKLAFGQRDGADGDQLLPIVATDLARIMSGEA